MFTNSRSKSVNTTHAFENLRTYCTPRWGGCHKLRNNLETNYTSGDLKKTGAGYFDYGLLLTMLRHNDERIKKLEKKVDSYLPTISYA